MLAAYLRCQRQFQLRYIDRLVWPDSLVDELVEQSFALGTRFHELVSQILLGMAVEPAADEDPKIGIWLERFQQRVSSLPSGQRFVEFNLTVPIGAHYLSGRMDLLIVSDDQLHIFDWKTDTYPPNRDHLWQNMQTRVYLALAAEGAEALGKTYEASDIAITYWYPIDPPRQIRLNYDQEKHAENWGILEDIVLGIDWLTGQDAIWPKTADLSTCRRCPYQIICGRQAGSLDLDGWNQDDQDPDIEVDWS